MQVPFPGHFHFRESLKPMVRLSGNIHGNEAVGREISLAFARFSVFVFVFVFSVFVFVFVRREISLAFARYLNLPCMCHTNIFS